MPDLLDKILNPYKTKTILYYRIKKNQKTVVLDISSWHEDDIVTFMTSKTVEIGYVFRKNPKGSYCHSDQANVGKWKPGLGVWTEKQWNLACKSSNTGLAESIDICHRVMMGWSSNRIDLPTSVEAQKMWPELLNKIHNYEQKLMINGLL